AGLFEGRLDCQGPRPYLLATVPAIMHQRLRHYFELPADCQKERYPSVMDFIHRNGSDQVEQLFAKCHGRAGHPGCLIRTLNSSPCLHCSCSSESKDSVGQRRELIGRESSSIKSASLNAATTAVDRRNAFSMRSSLEGYQTSSWSAS